MTPVMRASARERLGLSVRSALELMYRFVAVIMIPTSGNSKKSGHIEPDNFTRKVGVMSEETPEVSTPRRGWSSQNMEVVAVDDDRYWSVFDAATLLGPPSLSEAQVRHLIKLAGFKPVGKRHNGPRRRHIPVYFAKDLIAIHGKIAEATNQD